MQRMTRTAAVLMVSAAMLGACETPLDTQRLPEITFAHMQRFNVDVAKVEVIHASQSMLKAPHVEHLLPTSPARALERWAQDRFKAVGRSGTLRLVVDEASALETPLARDKSLKGNFTKQQSHRYDMAIRARLELMDGPGRKLATAGANASRSVTVREDITLNEREKTWFDTVDLLTKDFDREIDANIRRYLADWIR